jgi:transcriptional regulator of heat shock response
MNKVLLEFIMKKIAKMNMNKSPEKVDAQLGNIRRLIDKRYDGWKLKTLATQSHKYTPEQIADMRRKDRQYSNRYIQAYNAHRDFHSEKPRYEEKKAKLARREANKAKVREKWNTAKQAAGTATSAVKDKIKQFIGNKQAASSVKDKIKQFIGKKRTVKQEV